MEKGRKIRVIAIVILIALLASTEYKTLYEVAVASSFINKEKDTASLENSGEEVVVAQSAHETSEAETTVAETTADETIAYETASNETTATENVADDMAVAESTAITEESTADVENKSMADTENESITESTGDITVSGNVTSDDEVLDDNDANDDETDNINDIDGNETDDNNGSDVAKSADGINEKEAGDTEEEAVEGEEADANSIEADGTVSENELAEELEQVGAGFGEASFPTEVADFGTWYIQQDDHIAHIKTLQDWLNFQELSQKTSLDGYVFQIDANTTSGGEGSTIYDLTGLSGYTGDDAKYNFTGIGSSEFPFKGTLTCWLSSGLSIKTKVPIFNYLSAGSTVSKLSIICDKSSAGLAAHVKGGGTVNLSNITISGTISGSGAAGALFGEICNDDATTLKVQITKENNVGVLFAMYNGDKVTMTGAYAGAIAGYVTGNVELEIDTALYDVTNIGNITGAPIYDSTSKKYVYPGAIGSLIGKVDGNTTYQPKIILNNTTAGADTIEIPKSNKLTAKGNAGGVIGHMNYGILYTSGKKVVIGGNSGGEYIVCTDNSGNGGIGGAIGVLENSTIVKNSRFELSNTLLRTNAALYGIGGFFGVVKNSNIQACDAVVGTDGTTTTPTMFSVSNVYVHAIATAYGAGGIVGCYQDDKNNNSIISQIEINNIKVYTQDKGVKTSVGVLIGQFVANNNSTFELSDWSINGFQVAANIGAGAGGAVGTASGDGTGTITLKNGIVNNTINKNVLDYNSGTEFLIWETQSKVGGVLGTLKAGNCHIESITSNSLSLRSDRECGGLIGETEGNETKKYLSIKDINLGEVCVSNDIVQYYGYGSKGLLIGKVGKNSIVKLDGNLDFSNTIWYWTDKTGTPPFLGSTYHGDKTPYVGKIAGIQEQAVIYLDTGANYIPYEYKSNGTNDDKKVKYVDEIGNFGGVYRNGEWGESGQKLFDEDNVNGTVVKEGDSYVIDSIADLMRFAIVMNSEGAFGTECFGYVIANDSDKAQAYAALLSADYLLEAETYDLTGTGVVSLQRTIGRGTSTLTTTIPEELTTTPQMFKGSFSGTDANNLSEIILNVNYYRLKNNGLFANVGSESGETTQATFKNLKLTADIIQLESTTNKNSYSNNSVAETGSMGGLSVYAKGNVTVDNCELSVNMESRKYVSSTPKKAYYGGLFGRYEGLNGSNLTVTNVAAAGTKTVRDNDHYASQFIASVVSPYNSSTLPVISLSDITISGSITNTNTYDNSYDIDTYSYLGGLITVMNENKEDGSRELSWESGKEAFHYFNTERTKLEVTNLTVSGFALTNSKEAKRSSGLLGFRWLDVDAKLTNIKIGDESASDKTTKLTAYKRFGGLLNEVCGRMDVSQATICNTEITSNNTVDYSSLLVAEASYLYLSVTDYEVKDSTAISLSKDSYFDEIAGCSKEGGSSESSGAVVSVSTTGVNKSLFIDNYHSYENGATYTVGGAEKAANEILNRATRYYYDIPTIMNNGGNLIDATINTPEELMRWHLLQYCRSHLRKYFFTAAESTSSTQMDLVRKQDYQIDGTIDLNGYSYYPTSIEHRSITGTNNATIIFHGQEIIDKESDSEVRQRQPYEKEKSQYMLHSAVFKDIAGVTVSNLTLSGTVSEVGNYFSGALVSGEIEGVKVTEGDEDDKLGYMYSTKAEDYTNISNITLDNLWVARKSKESWGGTNNGLLIASIVRGAKVNFDSIRMSNYDVSNSPTEEDKAARALIAVVGKSSDKYITEEDSEIQLNFTNMDIADVADGTDLTDKASCPDLNNSSENDKVLKSASLICYYYYYEDSSYSIYTFTKADYLSGKGIICDANDPDYAKVNDTTGSGYITMGDEINEDTEYIDENIDTKILQDRYGFKNTNYKPYIYKERAIIVNPKPGHITEGCGTYEDPYVIKTDKQLKSVYYYLKNQTSQLINWKINPIGNDETFCNKNHNETEVKTFGRDIEDFPTREQLSQAYYLINPEADTEGNRIIDLTSCEDFVGFGSLNEPFIGVIVGCKNGDSIPVIKLPGYVNSDQDIDSFGLVRYAKGCVVKDLAIELGTTKTESDVDTTYYVGIKGAGAGVFGNVCGGDNVIDNVTVKGTLQAADVAQDSTYSMAQIGGYAGCVDLGTVILRNINANSLKEFRITDSANASIVGNSFYIWLGGIIGRVKDGAVVYEGASDSSSPIVKNGTTGFAYVNDLGLEVSPNYGILNAAYLNDVSKCGNVEVDTTGEELTIKAENPGQLMLMTMALNSGCFTYVGNTESELRYRNGYGADSRCRNGNYEKVGTVTVDTDNDYVDIVTNDNLNGKQPTTAAFYSPYLFQYFTESDVSLQTVLLGTGTTLAYNDPAISSKYIVMDANNLTLQLASDKNYDMTIFENSFRGIGGGYFKENNTFKGNVEGNNSTINLSYISNTSLGIDNIGLFNTVVVDAQSDGCYMKDLTITGTLLNADVVSDVKTLTDDLLTGDSISGKSAAGLIGRLEIESNLNAANLSNNKYNYSFTNIKVNNINVETQEYAGGLIGRIVCTPEGGQNSTYSNALYFENCVVGKNSAEEDSEAYNTTIKGLADVGGIIASYQDAIDVTFKDCKVLSVDLQARGMHLYQVLSGTDKTTWLDRKVYPSAGGFIGRGVGSGKTITVIGGEYNKISLKSKGHMGGVIGETESKLLVNGDVDTNKFTGKNISFSGLETSTTAQITNDNLIDTVVYANGSYNTAAACYQRTKYVGSFGGFAGFLSGPASQLYNINLVSINGNIPTGIKNKTFMGGLIGRLYNTKSEEYIISDCKIGDENTAICLVSQGTRNDTNRVSTGGLTGGIETNAIVSFTRCSVVGNSSGSSILEGTDTAAGMNAYVKSGSSTNENNFIYYDDCTVKNLSVNGGARTAGVEGYRTGENIKVSSTFYKVTVSDCTLHNMDTWTVGGVCLIASGGLQGYSNGHAIAVDCAIKNVQMKGIETYAAGGLVGRAEGNYAWIQAANTTVEGCTISGAAAGGVAGRIDKNSWGDSPSVDQVTIKNNKIIGYCNDSSTPWRIGGLYGVWSSGQTPIMGEDIEISNNLIGALLQNKNQIGYPMYMGGMVGLTWSDIKIKSPTLKNNIVSILDTDAVKASINGTSYKDLEEHLISDSFGIWENGTVSASKVENVHPVMCNTQNNKQYVSYQEFSSEDAYSAYVDCVGLVVGYNATEKRFWITDAKVSYDEGLRIYRPAADVGSFIIPGQYKHVVYGEYDDQYSTEDDTTLGDNSNIAEALGLSDGDYQFGDLLKIWTDYNSEEKNKKYAYRLASNYQGEDSSGTKIAAENTTKQILEGTFYDSTEGYRSIYKNTEEKVIPMLVYDNQESIDEMINTVVNVLTNNGGCLRKVKADNFVTVTAKKMVVENGKVRLPKEGEDTEASIKVSAGDSTNYVCNVNSKGYDVQEDEKNGTFTVLHIEYSWKYTTSDFVYNKSGGKYQAEQTQTMVLDIPVYIEEVLEYQTHITGVQGAEYYLDNLLANGKSDIQTLRDSYTAYVEYDYNASYTKYNSRLHKEIVYKDTGTGNDVNIPAGTRFVLIDVSDNGHAYYYSVENASASVPFSYFKDSEDIGYTEKAISQLAEFTIEGMSKTLYSEHENESDKSMPSDKYAIQQYILLVDSSEVTGAAANYAYEFIVQPDKDDTKNPDDVETATLIRRSINKTCPKECKLKITEYQGISGAFNEEHTTLTGEISPEENVTINLEYDITAPGEYWTYLSANQGSNLSQYLDVAIYLQKDGNRIALPLGTQVIFNKDTEKQAVGVMQGNTILYQYKDAGLSCDLNELTGNVKLSGTIDLDFSSADFTGFDNGEYTVIFDLLKTKDANFPMGGEVLDTFTTQVKSSAEKNLGFVLETTDLLALGMNGYLPEESDSGVINCNMKIDFSDYLGVLGQPSKEMTEMANKYFTVQFEIQKKVKADDGSLSYETYNGDLVKVYFGESENAWANPVDGSKVVYKFTEDFMKEGYSPDENKEKSVVSFPYTVVADVDGLLETYDNITNYRVIAKLYLTDNMPSGTKAEKDSSSPEGCEIHILPSVNMSAAAESMKDYFVFTVAKIKTDLDITN